MFESFRTSQTVRSNSQDRAMRTADRTPTSENDKDKLETPLVNSRAGQQSMSGPLLADSEAGRETMNAPSLANSRAGRESMGGSLANSPAAYMGNDSSKLSGRWWNGSLSIAHGKNQPGKGRDMGSKKIPMHSPGGTPIQNPQPIYDEIGFNEQIKKRQ